MNSNKANSLSRQPFLFSWLGKEGLAETVVNQRTRKTLGQAARRGSMLVEVTVSAALLATLLVIINQTVVQLHRQTKLVDRHLLAQQTLENLLEDAVRTPWSALTTDTLANLELPEIALAKIPQAELSGEVTEELVPVPAKRVTLRLNWQGVSGSPQRPMVLTTWVYKQQEVNP